MAKAWMPFYIADYLADTGHLTAEQHGIYVLSLFHYWQTEQPLTANAEQLQMICRYFDAAKFEQQWCVVSEFYVLDGHVWRHLRMDKELLKAHKLSETRAKAAKVRYEKPTAKAPANAVQLDTQSQSQSQSQDKPKKSVSRFAPPTLDEVQAYCHERNNFVDPEKFIDFYESKGWMVGKNKMKSWQASVRTWEKDKKTCKTDMSIPEPIGGFRESDL